MPPYAASRQEVLDHDDDDDGTMGLHKSNSYGDDPMVDVPRGSKMVHNTILQNDESTEADIPCGEKRSSFSFLERWLDFNPCARVSLPSLPNPSSALFKERPCAECGKNCTKMRGYSKKVLERRRSTVVAGEESPAAEQDKIYFHEWCAKIRGYRSTHKDSYGAVLRNLLDYFRALEFEKKTKREAEEKRRNQEQLATEKAARNAPLEVNLVEKPKKKPGFWKRAGNRIRTAFSIESCTGTTEAVDDTMETCSI